MFQYFINLRFLFFILYISIKFSLSLSETVLLCYKDNFEIKCPSDNSYIIIKDSTFGYFTSLKKPSSNQSHWCIISNSNTYTQECKISVLNRIGKKCSGKRSCKLNILFSQYLPKDSFPCPDLSANNHLLNLYIDYECVPKDLLYNVAELNNVHFPGGYLTSVAYIPQKMNDNDDFKAVALSYTSENLLPLKISFRPITLMENRISFPIVFQFQILENTLYPYQNHAILSNLTNTCQVGKLYFQDYYAFTPDNYLNSNEVNNRSITICQYSSDLVGEVFQIQNVTKIFITANVNFNSSAKMNRGLLIKYSAIFCSLLKVINAKISYDNKISQSLNLHVNVFAKIECNTGYFFLSLNNSKETSMILNCDHDKRLWDSLQIPKKCINKMPTLPITITMNTTMNTIISNSWKINTKNAQTLSTNILFTTQVNESYISISMISKKQSPMTIAIISLLGFFGIFSLAAFVAGYLYCKKKNKIKYLSGNCSLLSKCFTQKTTIRNINGGYIYRNHFANSSRYQVIDSGTPMSGSLGYIGHCFSESYRQSNRTSITRADSKPTITSRDSFPTSNNASDFDVHRRHHEEELPTKVPKQSPLIKLANSFKITSFSGLRPMSSSNQSFLDRSSNFYDTRYSNSQVALSKMRRNNIASEFIEISPSMWTSDISPSKTMPKSKMPNKRNSEFSNNSQSDVSLKYNTKIYSPTVDTYLEPTLEMSNRLGEEYSQKLLSQNERKKSEDYMIYDHSRVSSNNIDFTCPSSITESGSDINPNENEENKRFSMISNNYYGIQSSDINHNPTQIYNPIIERINNNSTESVYESIDEDPTYQSTLERRNIALPLPPNE